MSSTIEEITSILGAQRIGTTPSYNRLDSN